MEAAVTFLWCHSARSPHHGNLLVQLICQRNTIILSRDLEYNGHTLITHTLLSLTRTVRHTTCYTRPPLPPLKYTTTHVQPSHHLDMEVVRAVRRGHLHLHLCTHSRERWWRDARCFSLSSTSPHCEAHRNEFLADREEMRSNRWEEDIHMKAQVIFFVHL